MKYNILILLISICFISCKKEEANPNLVAHWSLNNNVNDESSFQSHGKVYGNPKYVNSVIDGKALDFNGNDFVEIIVDGKAPSQIKDLSVGSISLWFKTRSWDIGNTILPILHYGSGDICEDAIDVTNGGMIIEVGHGGIFPSENLFFTLYDKPCKYPTMCFDSNNNEGKIIPDKWYHFVAVVGEDYNTGYLNGKELLDRRYNFDSKSSTLFFDDFINHEKMWIGKSFWKGKEVFFDGLIDDVRIYNKPLNLEDVSELYNSKL